MTERPLGCDCDLRDRQWNPFTGKCETCGGRFRDLRAGLRSVTKPREEPVKTEPVFDERGRHVGHQLLEEINLRGEGPTLDQRLVALLNEESVDTVFNTPDFILANYLLDCLVAFKRATDAKDAHGRKDRAGTSTNGER